MLSFAVNALILRRLFNVIDDEHRYGAVCRFELEAELLLKGRI
jgi:hypothetical protein